MQCLLVAQLHLCFESLFIIPLSSVCDHIYRDEPNHILPMPWHVFNNCFFLFQVSVCFTIDHIQGSPHHSRGKYSVTNIYSLHSAVLKFMLSVRNRLVHTNLKAITSLEILLSVQTWECSNKIVCTNLKSALTTGRPISVSRLFFNLVWVSTILLHRSANLKFSNTCITFYIYTRIFYAET